MSDAAQVIIAIASGVSATVTALVALRLASIKEAAERAAREAEEARRIAAEVKAAVEPKRPA